MIYLDGATHFLIENMAIEIVKECGADGWVQRYEEDLPMLRGSDF